MVTTTLPLRAKATPSPTPRKGSNDSDFFGELKYRMDMTVSDDEKKVKGVVGFEFGSSKFGGSGADFGGDDNVFELRWAYTDLELPFDSCLPPDRGSAARGLQRPVVVRQRRRRQMDP